MAIVEKTSPVQDGAELDKNKTPLTHRITAVAVDHLDRMGFKPVETEVPVAGKWIADVASFIYPTPTEAKKLKLISGGLQEYREIDFRYGPLLTALVEVKISRSDFTKDEQRKFNNPHPPAHLCYLAYPTGLLDKEEIPRGWIGLAMSKNGERLMKVHRTWAIKVYPQHPGDVANFIAQVAIRRDHRTRYKALRELRRAYNARETNDRKVARIHDIIRALLEALTGESAHADKTLTEILRWFGFDKLPDYLQKQVATLEEIRKQIAVQSTFRDQRKEKPQ
ncbi:MAG: hypothetical protein KAV00_03465 [Phycisphaerae bacterium]|nr:hypothetical protein [Phycisphaerae bacterium]